MKRPPSLLLLTIRDEIEVKEPTWLNTRESRGASWLLIRKRKFCDVHKIGSRPSDHPNTNKKGYDGKITSLVNKLRCLFPV